MAQDPDRTVTWAELYSYKLGRPQLDRLFALATDGFDPAEVTFETMQHQTLLRRRSLEELVQAVDSLSPQGVRDRWDNLTFEAGNDSSRVVIKFEWATVTLWTSGVDPIWAHGQSARIRSCMEAAGAVPRDPIATRVRTERVLMCIAGAGIAAVLFWGLVLASAKQVSSYVWYVMPPFMLVAFCGTLSAVTDPTFGWKHGGFLIVRGEVARPSWWDASSRSNKIAMGALIVSVVATLAAVGSTYADLR